MTSQTIRDDYVPKLWMNVSIQVTATRENNLKEVVVTYNAWME